MKRRVAIAAAVVGTLVASAIAVDAILNWHASSAAAAARRPDPSFALSLPDFSSNIPIIVLRADRSGPVSGSRTYSAFTMEIREPGKNGPARLADSPTATMRTGVRLRGMVSRMFPKLSYRLKLQDEKGASQERSLLGMPADADWALQGPWLDKSLIRNAFSYDLARAMGAAGMRTRVCEVFLTVSGRPLRDADYLGVYQVTEDIERGDERVNSPSLGPRRTPSRRSPAGTCWPGTSAMATICPDGTRFR